jgi:hypothetical protein
MVPYVLDSIFKISFKVSIKWTRNFIKKTLNWSCRASTTIVRKLSKDREDQGKKMAQRLIYFSKLYDIPLFLMINRN